MMQAFHISRISIQPLGTPSCLPQNFHNRRASVAHPGGHLRVNELTKVEEQEGYRILKSMVMLTAPYISGSDG
jgi:hypothetical protein